MNDDRPPSEPTDQGGQRRGRPSNRPSHHSVNKDITPLLKGWDYEPGTINVRKINGNDGEPKLQMRLDLGLIQMEVNGRPDGMRPHGHESLLDYFESQLREHETRNGTELGFHLTAQQCQSLREEAALYYHRYLSLFVLEEFPGVVRDTDRNLRVLDLCGKYAVNEQDRLILEQYRPYLTMMNTRAAASIFYRDEKFAEALKVVKRGISRINEFFERFDQAEAAKRSNEFRVLKRFAREIRKKMPIDPLEKLNAELNRAVKDERYEDAAKLRDEIHQRHRGPRQKK
ncbi:MAG: UvrB/UvrC motif-containing protein [Phycisphaerae bacterium]|nr:UvrB/UvrC motif-containing protein [Phycisphaerae bacterium]